MNLDHMCKNELRNVAWRTPLEFWCTPNSTPFQSYYKVNVVQNWWWRQEQNTARDNIQVWSRSDPYKVPKTSPPSIVWRVYNHISWLSLHLPWLCLAFFTVHKHSTYAYPPASLLSDCG
jgi:hypothetical protein